MYIAEKIVVIGNGRSLMPGTRVMDKDIENNLILSYKLGGRGQSEFICLAFNVNFFRIEYKNLPITSLQPPPAFVYR